MSWSERQGMISRSDVRFVRNVVAPHVERRHCTPLLITAFDRPPAVLGEHRISSLFEWLELPGRATHS